MRLFRFLRRQLSRRRVVCPDCHAVLGWCLPADTGRRREEHEQDCPYGPH